MHKYQPRLHVIVLDQLDGQVNKTTNRSLAYRCLDQTQTLDNNNKISSQNKYGHLDSIRQQQQSRQSSELSNQIDYCETCAKNSKSENLKQSAIDRVADHNLTLDQNKNLRKKFIDTNMDRNFGLDFSFTSNDTGNCSGGGGTSSTLLTSLNIRNTPTSSAPITCTTNLENLKRIDNAIDTADQMVNHDNQSSLNRSYSNFKLSTCYRCQTNLSQSNFAGNRMPANSTSSKNNGSANSTSNNLADFNATNHDSKTNDSANQSIVRFKTFRFIETRFFAVTGEWFL